MGRAHVLRVLPIALAGVALSVPSVAQAAGGTASPRSIGLVVALVIGVGTAYLAAHLVVDRLQRRLLVVAGAEYLLLGVLLGPLVPEITAFENVTPLMPIIALAAGWVGLLRGTELRLRSETHFPPGTVRVVLVHHLVSGGVVAAGAWLFFTELEHLLGPVPWEQAAMSAGVLACCAATDSAVPIGLVSRRYEADGELIRLLRRSALLGDLFVIFVFGLLFCVFHTGDDLASYSLRATEWAALSIGLGLVLGLVFTSFIVGNESPNARFLALVGIITFASGAAWFMRLDPLLVNLVLGVVVVNTARSGHLVRSTLQNTEQPIRLVLLVLAGALWRPLDPTVALIGIGGFIVLRLVGKVVASLLAAWGTPLRADLFRGLLAHGEVAIAMVVSFRLVYQGPAVDFAYTVVLASVVFHDLIGPRLLRGLLVDAGEIRGEVPEMQPKEQEAT